MSCDRLSPTASVAPVKGAIRPWYGSTRVHTAPSRGRDIPRGTLAKQQVLRPGPRVMLQSASRVKQQACGCATPCSRSWRPRALGLVARNLPSPSGPRPPAPLIPAKASSGQSTANPSFIDDLKASAYPGPRLSEINSWAFFGVTIGFAVVSLATFNVLASAIYSGAVAHGYQGDVASLGILDLRNGYSPEEVSLALGAWGPEGRMLYLGIEAVDVTLYHFGYRGAGVVLFNRLSSFLSPRTPAAVSGWLRYLALGPVVVAASDFLEDAAQVLVVLSYSGAASGEGPGWWPALVGVASTLNVAKWTLCRGGVALGAAGALAAAGLALWERVAGGVAGPAGDAAAASQVTGDDPQDQGRVK